MARNGKLLKRLVAAPARRSHLLAAQLLSRLIFLVPEAGALLLFACVLLHVPLRGSLVALAVVSLLGALAFTGLGLLTAARPRDDRGRLRHHEPGDGPDVGVLGGLLRDGALPEPIQPFVKALPLTALNDALRAVMLDGAGLAATAAAAPEPRGLGRAELRDRAADLPLAVSRAPRPDQRAGEGGRSFQFRIAFQTSRKSDSVW